MKKSLLSLAICLISFNAFAELSIKIPLELANGGSLPNGTIIMGPATEPEPFDDVADCKAFADKVETAIDSQHSQGNFIKATLVKAQSVYAKIPFTSSAICQIYFAYTTSTIAEHDTLSASISSYLQSAVENPRIGFFLAGSFQHTE